MSRRIVIPICSFMPPLVVDMWDPSDLPSITPGCSGGRRRNPKKPKVYRKQRAKAKKTAKASKKRNR